MLDNVITLQVNDDADDGTTALVPTPYSRHSEYGNRSMYIATSHSVEAKNTLSFYRSAEKRNGNFKGVAKTSFKLSSDKTVLGVDGVSQLTAPLIVEVNFALPVGVNQADVIALRQTAVALLGEPGIMDQLLFQLMI